MNCLDVFFVHNFLTGFLQIHIVVYSLWLCYTVILIFILGFTLFLCPLLSNFDSFVVLAKLTFEIDILNKMVSMYAFMVVSILYDPAARALSKLGFIVC